MKVLFGRIRALFFLPIICVTSLVSFFVGIQPHLTTPQPIAPIQNVSKADEHDQSLILVQPRAFPKWPRNVSLPCHPPDGVMKGGKVLKSPNHRYPASEGLFFVKTHKTASSTVAGVTLRVSRRLAQRQGKEYDFCKTRFGHAQGTQRSSTYSLYANRTILGGQSLLWAVIREPTQRAISAFFHFQVTQGRTPKEKWNNQTIATHFIDWAKHKLGRDYYIHHLRLRAYNATNYKQQPPQQESMTQISNEILEKFDFIGVTERLDESLVAFSMLMGIPLSDVLYLSAKVSGGWDGQCKQIHPTVVLPRMRTFLQSQFWKNHVQYDLALYQAVNQSLDRTIEHTIGRHEFAQNLAKYREMLAAVHRVCPNQTVFKCTPTGQTVPDEKTDCIWRDLGCGDPCLDKVALSFGM